MELGFRSRGDEREGWLKTLEVQYIRQIPISATFLRIALGGMETLEAMLDLCRSNNVELNISQAAPKNKQQQYSLGIYQAMVNPDPIGINLDLLIKSRTYTCVYKDEIESIEESPKISKGNIRQCACLVSDHLPIGKKNDDQSNEHGLGQRF